MLFGCLLLDGSCVAKFCHIEELMQDICRVENYEVKRILLRKNFIFKAATMKYQHGYYAKLNNTIKFCLKTARLNKFYCALPLSLRKVLYFFY